MKVSTFSVSDMFHNNIEVFTWALPLVGNGLTGFNSQVSVFSCALYHNIFTPRAWPLILSSYYGFNA